MWKEDELRKMLWLKSLCASALGSMSLAHAACTTYMWPIRVKSWNLLCPHYDRCLDTLTGSGFRRWPRGRGALQSLFSKRFHSWSFLALEGLLLVHMSLTQTRSQVAKISWRLVFCQFYAWLPKATPASWQDGVACQAITLQNPCGFICCEINSSRLLLPSRS